MFSKRFRFVTSCWTLIALLLIIGCQPPPPILVANDVNLNPLLELPLPAHVRHLDEIFEPNKLDSKRWSLRKQELADGEYLYHIPHSPASQYDEVNIIVDFWVDEDEVKAVGTFHTFCESTRPFYKSGEYHLLDATYRYCIPYLEQARNSAEGFYLPYNKWYYGQLTLQLRNLVITFSEQTGSIDRTVINQVVQEVAEAIRAKLQ